MSALALTVVGALATDPGCGAALKGSDLAAWLVATAQHESGGDPLTIGIVADPPTRMKARLGQLLTSHLGSGRYATRSPGTTLSHPRTPSLHRKSSRALQAGAA